VGVFHPGGKEDNILRVNPPPGIKEIMGLSAALRGCCCTGEVYVGIGKDVKLSKALEASDGALVGHS